MDIASHPRPIESLHHPTGLLPAAVPLADRDGADPRRAGTKAATLAALARAGIPVPDGFVVAVDVFERCLESAGVRRELDTIEAAVRPSDPGDLLQASTRMTGLVRSASLTPSARREILDAYQHLGALAGGGAAPVPVAVRPSIPGATAAASFAGVGRTCTSVLGGPDLLRRIVDCWSSNVSPRAIAYRRSCGIGGPSDVAVLVQTMVMSERSAVASSIDPTGRSAGDLLVEAVRGLGEVIADGTVVPDRYHVHREGREIAGARPGRQDHQIMAARGCSNRRMPLSPARSRLVLEPAEVLAIVDTVDLVEELLGTACVVDVAVDGHGGIVVLQVRPCAPVVGREAPSMVPSAPGEADVVAEAGPRPRVGIGASPGIAVGPARIVGTSEMACVGRGAVLVTPAAGMACVPALDGAVGVVTDEGGVLSNLAFVCRERGIPAVFGTGSASRALTPGSMVTVDGNRGTVS